MAITALSPWGAIFRVPLSANSIFNSPSFLTQVPDKLGLSAFFSSAVAARPARARAPQANTTPHLRLRGTITFDTPSRKAAAARGMAAGPAAGPAAGRADARGIN